MFSLASKRRGRQQHLTRTETTNESAVRVKPLAAKDQLRACVKEATNDKFIMGLEKGPAAMALRLGSEMSNTSETQQTSDSAVAQHSSHGKNVQFKLQSIDMMSKSKAESIIPLAVCDVPISYKNKKPFPQFIAIKKGDLPLYPTGIAQSPRDIDEDVYINFLKENESASLNFNKIRKETQSDVVLKTTKLELFEESDCLFCGKKVVILRKLEAGVEHFLHAIHTITVKIKLMACERCWWPQQSKDLENIVKPSPSYHI
uniref:Uncharacterized protein n=1 Tax=Glossina austeni TaxID=7395 RepID=A0A1A9VPN9_GLOAU